MTEKKENNVFLLEDFEKNPSAMFLKIFSALGKKAVEKIEEDKAVLLEKRFKIVNRIRKGKVQRRKKVSTKDGYTFRNGRYVRMKAQERRRRKVSQRKAARKRKGKKARSSRNRRISIRKTKRLGNLR